MRTVHHFIGLLLLTFIGLLLSSCGGTGINLPGTGGGQPAQQAPTATAIPTAPAVARPTYLVQRGDVQEILEFNGRWQPRDQLALSFSVSGTVRRVTVKNGDTVTAGQLLADFQITDLENQLQQAQLDLQTAKYNLNSGSDTSVASVADAEIALANAKLNLQKTIDGNPWTQVASAKVALDNARAALANAQRAYDDAISHPEQPAAQIEQAYNNLQNAKNSLKSAEINYDSAAQNYNNYLYTIKNAQNAVIQAQLNLEKAKTSGGDPVKQQAVYSAQLKVDQIQENINNSSLFAPIAGVVLDVTIKAGDAVKAFDTVITIGRPEPKEAIASLAIGDAQKLSVGLVGICEVINKPETAVQCVVRRIPLSSKDADQTTRVAASLDDLNLASGQLIDIQMPLNVRSNVLWLPPAAVRTFQNRTFVVLQTPDGPRSVDVEIGLRTTDRVEIKSGVNEGDVVIGP